MIRKNNSKNGRTEKITNIEITCSQDSDCLDGLVCRNNHCIRDVPQGPTFDCNCEYNPVYSTLNSEIPNTLPSIIIDHNDYIYVMYRNAIGIQTLAWVARFKNGVLDTIFGTSGSVSITYPIGANTQIESFIILSNGNFAFLSLDRVWQSNPNGTVYNGFTPVNMSLYYPPNLTGDQYLVAIPSAGFYAYWYTSGIYNQYIMKFTPAGVNTSYGTAGVMQYDFGMMILGSNDFSRFQDLKVLQNGSLIVFTTSYTQLSGNIERPLIVKLTPDGTLDTSFGTNGYVFYIDSPSMINTWSAIGAIAPDGSIYVAGWGPYDINVNYDEASLVLKFTPDGVLDTTWADSGTFVYFFPDRYAEITSMSVEPCGSLILAVPFYEANPPYANAIHILRLDTQGVINPAYPIFIPEAYLNYKLATITGSGLEGNPLNYSILIIDDVTQDYRVHNFVCE